MLAAVVEPGLDHIRAIRGAVRMMNARRSEARVVGEVRKSERPRYRNWEERSESQLGVVLRSGKKALSIELNPPKGTDLTKFLGAVETVEKAGVRFVNIPDGARASARVGSLHLAALVNRTSSARNGGEPRVSAIPHFTTRDRNLIALQSDLLQVPMSTEGCEMFCW